jgi:hypothetical protein
LPGLVQGSAALQIGLETGENLSNPFNDLGGAQSDQRTASLAV